MGFLSDLLLGSKPSTDQFFTDPNRTVRDLGTLSAGVNDELMQIISQAMGGLSQFGPGFQGTAGTAAGKSILPLLGQLLQSALHTSTPTVVQSGGSPGLLQTALGGFAGGAGVGLGANLFGGASKPPLSTIVTQDRRLQGGPK